MNSRFISIVFLLLAMQYPLMASAQSVEEAEQENNAIPEEIVVTTNRSKLQLRLQLWDAEEKAYGVFNSFNDEKRFDIKCYLHEPTGTRIKRQICTPEFQLQATRDHAQDYINGILQHVPVDVQIASQLGDYRGKIKQVAEEHPEFLNAIIEYTEKRQQYIEATSWKSKDSE